MKPLNRLLLAILLLTCLPTQAQMHRYATNFVLSERAFCDTVDIEWEQHQVYVSVYINGRRHRFLLDTGSSQGVVYADRRLDGCQNLGHIVSHDAVGRTDTVEVVGLPPLQLGRLTVSGYVATVQHRPVSGRNVDGIIGFDLFNKGVIGKIDVRRRHLILTDLKRSPLAAETGYALKYKLLRFVPHVWVSPFMRHNDQVLFDTGSRQLYAMNKQSFDRHAYKSHQVQAQVEGRSAGQLAIGHFGPERLDTVVFLALNRLRWDAFSLLDVHCITTQGNSYVGAPLLAYGSVTVNPFRKTLLFRPYNDADTVTVGNRQFQMAFVPQAGRAAVGLIWEHSQAYRRGFRQGDVILSIDGHDVPTFQSFVSYPFISGHEHLFLVRTRDGRLKEVRSSR